MRIAFDVSIQQTATPTGVERAQATLIDALLDAGPAHDFLLMTPDRVRERWREHPRVICAEGKGRAAWLWRETVLPREVRRAQVDLFHSPVAAIPMRLSCPLIATVHEVPWAGEDAGPGDERNSHKLRLHLAAGMAWRLLCPSERTAEHVRRLYPDAAERVVVLPHALTPRLVTPSATERDPRLVLSVGRLRAKKNLGALLEAFARLVAGPLPDARLVVVGPDGDAAAELRARSEREDLRGHVDWLGFVDDQRLAELYARAACVALPSLFEGFGLPALEAMAAGAPLLATTQGVARELAEGAALRVDGESVAALAEGLERLLLDGERARALAAVGRERARRYSREALVTSLLELYGSCP